MRKLFVIIMACIIGSASALAHTDPAELASAKVIHAIEMGDLPQAKKLANDLTRDYPDFKMGHLLNAEVDSIILGYNPKNIQLDQQSKKTIDDLRQETQVRWEHTLYPPPKNSLPAALIKPAYKQKYVLVADVKRSRLYIFETQDGVPQLVADHYMGIGKGGYGKQKEGDMQTPLGVYKIESYISGSKLPDLYGAGAYPINYPNRWDAINRRTGHGIWIHGVPDADYSRPPLSSEGCMTMNNNALMSLAPMIDINATVLVITDQLKWLDKASWQQQQTQLLNTLIAWRDDWQSRDSQKYLRHYSPKFNDGRKNYQSWAAHKTRVNSQKQFIKVTLGDVSMYHYAGTSAPTVLVTFTQNYHSNNLTSQSRKSQLWQQNGNTWQIIYEGDALI